jgi:Heavy metal binding domain
MCSVAHLLAFALATFVVGQQPARYWCPMHPDVRADERISCARCGMTLAPIDASAFDENGLDIDVSRGRTPGVVALSIRVLDGEETVRDFEIVHERPFHLFVVSRDLSHFDHVHPEPGTDGVFRIDLRVPRPDVYRLVGDFYPRGGVPQTVQRTIVTPGFDGPVFAAATPLEADGREKTVLGLRIALEEEPLVAGRETDLSFAVVDAASGERVPDLEPFLGAPGHLLVMSADLADAIHSHPEEPQPVGTRDSGLGTQPGFQPPSESTSAVPSPQSLVPSKIVFTVRFPRAMHYRMWLQFQRRGTVVTVPFTVSVSEPGVEGRAKPERQAGSRASSWSP